MTLTCRIHAARDLRLEDDGPATLGATRQAEQRDAAAVLRATLAAEPVLHTGRETAGAKRPLPAAGGGSVTMIVHAPAVKAKPSGCSAARP